MSEHEQTYIVHASRVATEHWTAYAVPADLRTDGANTAAPVLEARASAPSQVSEGSSAWVAAANALAELIPVEHP